MIKGHASESSLVCHWQLGRKDKGKAVGPSGKIPHPLPQILLFTPFSLDLKTVWQKTLLITFFLLKKYSNKLSICPSVLPCPSRG